MKQIKNKDFDVVDMANWWLGRPSKASRGRCRTAIQYESSPALLILGEPQTKTATGNIWWDYSLTCEGPYIDPLIYELMNQFMLYKRQFEQIWGEKRQLLYLFTNIFLIFTLSHVEIRIKKKNTDGFPLDRKPIDN